MARASNGWLQNRRNPSSHRSTSCSGAGSTGGPSAGSGGDCNGSGNGGAASVLASLSPDVLPDPPADVSNAWADDAARRMIAAEPW